MRDELLSNALQNIDKLNRDPGYRALMNHQKQLRENPAYKAILEESNRRSRDPSYRALMEHTGEFNQNPAYRALFEFEKNRRHYQEINALTRNDHVNDAVFRRISDLRCDLSKNNVELWLNTNILRSEAKFKQFEESVFPSANIIYDRSIETQFIRPEEQSKKQQSDAASIVEKINEDYSAAIKELAADERLSMFVVVGKNEYKIKSLVAEEPSNRIKVFLDSGKNGLFVFFAPFELQVLFGKEKTASAKSRKRVEFLSYKRDANGKDEVRIISSRKKKNMKQLSIIRVVVASPGDVMPERNALEEAINEINKGIAGSYGLRLELARWETDSYPGFHLDGAQGLIDPILDIEDCDVFIGIFWKRFGTPTMNAQSGTEHEFMKAYQAWQKQGSPHIMFYFNQQPSFPSSLAETQQWGQVLEFKRNFPKEGLWWTYNGENEFEKLVRKHLTKFVMDYASEDEDDDDEISEVDNEPEVLHDEEININGNSHESYAFSLDAGNTLQVFVHSNEPLKIAVVDSEDVEAWLNNEEIDAYEFYENKKRINFNFEAEEQGEYTVIIANETFFANAEVDVKISYFE